MIEVIQEGYSGTGRRLQEVLEGVEVNAAVNWTGAPLAPLGGEEKAVILNSASRTNKLAQLIRLDLAGVRVPQYDLSGHGEDWYPRTLDHQQGRDFTSPIPAGEIGYYVRKLPLVEEWRLHFFKTKKGNLKLLRSGKKLPRVPNPHPWVRSHRLGWKISYCGGAPGDAVLMARKAVEALGLDFAAVDVGMLELPVAVVLEVNTCPGLDSGTLRLYADAIKERLS